MKWFLTAFLIACAVVSTPALADLRDWKTEYQKGLEAAKAGDFKKAAELFSLVNSETEVHPGVIFNYGLASARNGNSFKATMMFRLYLVMLPEAPNAAAVRLEIERLDEEILAKQTDLFRRALAAAKEFPEIAPESDYSRPKKMSLLDSIADSANAVGNSEIAEEAIRLARRSAEIHGYDYKPDDAAEQYRDNLDEAGDIVALVEAYPQFDDAEDYVEALLAALDGLSDYAPDGTLPFLEALPKELLTADNYTVNDLIKLALDSGSDDPFFTHRAWDDDFIYLKDTDLQDTVLAFQPPESWRPMAEKILRRKPDSVGTLAALSQSRQALKIVMDNRGNPFNPYGEWASSVRVAELSLAIGNVDGIKRARKQLLKLSDEETDFSKMSNVLLQTASGHIDKALAAMQDRAPEWDSWEQTMDLYYGRVAKTAARALMQKEKYKDAERMILEGTRAYETADLLRELADRMEEGGNTGETGRLRKSADEIETRTRGGWKPESDEQFERVRKWRKIANYYKFGFSNTESVDKAVEQALNTDYCHYDTEAECIINSLDYSAKTWGQNLMTIRALEKLDPENATWLTPETRKRLAKVRKEALEKIGPTAREALAKWLAEDDLDDDETRYKSINDHRMAASEGNAASVRRLIDLYDPEEKGLKAPEVASFIADGLRRGDRSLHDHVTSSFSSWPKPLRLEFQRVLADEGLYSSGIDGAIGPGTRKAIEGLFASAAPAN
ncbi:hypothetical protein [Roseibium sediminicola]|uniref:Peptidoglycan binding domain-containing protein n=1 Tax=Roseibium sediminicola TaxID=2933272 RepID=A0ABT0H0X1_9HYPH|nr:hypothetical protein [Roseibium sp. CAU 1639]MCK7615333.1 hypothetical protein [Roseibium sp. CAU 1639]